MFMIVQCLLVSFGRELAFGLIHPWQHGCPFFIYVLRINGAVGEGDDFMHRYLDMIEEVATSGEFEKKSDIEMLTQVVEHAKKIGFAGIVLRDETASTAFMLEFLHHKNALLHDVKGITINQNLSVEFVRKAILKGAQCVWMAPCSDEFQITNEMGTVLPEIYQLLEFMANAGCMLGIDYLDPVEAEQMVSLSKARGVKQIIVNAHPQCAVKMPLAMQNRLAEEGVYFERDCYFCGDAAENEIVEEIMATGLANNLLRIEVRRSLDKEFNNSAVLSAIEAMNKRISGESWRR